MKKDARARLESAIQQIESGNILMLLDEPGGSERILVWLRDLLARDIAEEKQAHAKILEILTRSHGLTSEEAARVAAQVESGTPYATEAGPCRKCEGRGRVDVFVRSTCFGEETRNDECPRCRGTGVDKSRIVVPAA